MDSSWSEHDVVESTDGSPNFRSEQSAWGAIVSFERRGSQTSDESMVASSSGREKEPQWIVDVLVNCAPKANPGESTRRYSVLCLLALSISYSKVLNIWITQQLPPLKPAEQLL